MVEIKFALVNRLGVLSLPRKSVVRLSDRPDMTLDVYRERKLTMQQLQMLFVTLKLLVIMYRNTEWGYSELSDQINLSNVTMSNTD